MLQITTLSENTAGLGNLLGERGLSILIETDGLSILFDTGRSISASHNANLLDIDLSRINKIVLSHGHSDHTGGLKEVLRRIGKRTEIIAHPDIWAVKYSRRQGEEERYIGIPFHRQTLESLGARFNLTKEPVRITGNIMTTGEIPMTTDYEEIEPYLQVKEGDSFKPDKLLDDQALIINTEPGLVVISGLCPPGHHQYPVPCPATYRREDNTYRGRWLPPHGCY